MTAEEIAESVQAYSCHRLDERAVGKCARGAWHHHAHPRGASADDSGSVTTAGFFQAFKWANASFMSCHMGPGEQPSSSGASRDCRRRLPGSPDTVLDGGSSSGVAIAPSDLAQGFRTVDVRWQGADDFNHGSAFKSGFAELSAGTPCVCWLEVWRVCSARILVVGTRAARRRQGVCPQSALSNEVF